MPQVKIDNVWFDDTDCDKDGMGTHLIVNLDNNQSIMVLLDSKKEEPFFSDVIAGRCGKPETDGERVFWDNGASLTFLDMIAMLQTADNAMPYSRVQNGEVTKR